MVGLVNRPQAIRVVVVQGAQGRMRTEKDGQASVGLCRNEIGVARIEPPEVERAQGLTAREKAAIGQFDAALDGIEGVYTDSGFEEQAVPEHGTRLVEGRTWRIRQHLIQPQVREPTQEPSTSVIHDHDDRLVSAKRIPRTGALALRRQPSRSECNAVCANFRPQTVE
jgi:hypothetical protein